MHCCLVWFEKVLDSWSYATCNSKPLGLGRMQEYLVQKIHIFISNISQKPLVFGQTMFVLQPLSHIKLDLWLYKFLQQVWCRLEKIGA